MAGCSEHLLEKEWNRTNYEIEAAYMGRLFKRLIDDISGARPCNSNNNKR